MMFGVIRILAATVILYETNSSILTVFMAKIQNVWFSNEVFI